MDPVVSPPRSRADPPSTATGGANPATSSPPARIPSSLRSPLVLIHRRQRWEGWIRQPPHYHQSRRLSAPPLARIRRRRRRAAWIPSTLRPLLAPIHRRRRQEGGPGSLPTAVSSSHCHPGNLLLLTNSS